ncbi:LysE family translocator [uncultured Aquabacterium sp.]|uniref:LysE family translocator n=1 Tax=Aquabacterium sp. TaxID=1872578 RepID=UPI0025E31C0D|nr:LysE family translocator [uncultured Aquabacterium sp.]
MLTPEQIFGFLLAAVAITAAPGPDNLMVLGMGMSKGRLQGAVFGLGCALGCLSHTVLAVLGVSALIAASPVAFTLLRIVGGAYLVWLGVQSLRSRGGVRAADSGQPDAALGALLLRGVVANAVNPKVVLFFLSFLPQFVVPAQGQVAGQMAVLGVLFTVQAAVLFGLLALFAGAIGRWLQRRPRAGAWLDRAAGALFIGLGARLLLVR